MDLGWPEQDPQRTNCLRDPSSNGLKVFVCFESSIWSGSSHRFYASEGFDCSIDPPERTLVPLFRLVPNVLTRSTLQGVGGYNKCYA